MFKNIVIILLSLIILGCTGQPIHDFEQEYIPTFRNGDSPSIEQVEKAIISAAQKRGWSPRIVAPGLIEARIKVRAHQAIVEIPYTATSYSIRYKDSKNLNYDNGKIHRNYNKWVGKLSGSIQREFGVRSQNF